MTDKDLAQLQLGIYGAVPVTWDYLTPLTNNVVWGAKRIVNDPDFPGGVTVIALRGSEIELDWLRDFDWLALPSNHREFGMMHPGFMMDLDSVWLEVKAHTTGPYVLIGHSLGAGRGRDLSAIMTLDGQPPLLLVCWGEPKVGFQQFAGWYRANCKFPSRSYRNGNGHTLDPVCENPPTAPLVEPYVHPAGFLDINVPPTDPNWHGIPLTAPMALHNMQLYAKGSAG